MSDASVAETTDAGTTETTETTETTVEETTQQTTEQSTAESTQQTAAQTETKSEDTSTTDKWRERIADEKIRKFAERFDSIEEMAKTGFEFRQKLSNAIRKPGKDASEEDVKAYHKALGVPDSPDGYQVEINEKAEEIFSEDDYKDLTGIVDGIKGKLHAAGATNEAVQAAVDEIVETLVSAEEADAQRSEQNYKKAEEALRKKWGPDEYSQNMEYAKRGYKQFGNEDFINMIESAKFEGVELSNHPVFAEVFSNIGRKMGEGGLQTVISEEDKKTTEEKMDTLTEQAHAAINSGDRLKADRLFKERDALASSYYGE